MKYLTKEWLVADKLGNIYDYIKTSARAERRDEEYYLGLYHRQSGAFIENEKKNPLYNDPYQELAEIEQYIHAGGTDASGQNERAVLRDLFIGTNKSRLKHGAVAFDEPTARRQFDSRLRERQRLAQYLPREITEKIADIRVFALGYATAEVKELLKPFCGEQKRVSALLKEKAVRESGQAAEALSADIDPEKYTESFLSGIRLQGGNVCLAFDYLVGKGDCLLIGNGEIVERELKDVYRWNADIPNSRWSRVVAAELHRADGRAEVHFLIVNKNEYDEHDYGYLTVRGTDIEILR